MSKPLKDQDFTYIAVRFAQLLVAGEYSAAYSLLSPSISDNYSTDKLKLVFEEMIEYWNDEKPIVDGCGETMNAWPGKKPNDIGWVYVPIEGDGEVEAVTVIVNIEDGKQGIRDIEWGRP